MSDTPRETTPPEGQVDADWRAMQYLTGELDAAAADRFEADLHCDQRLREALAAAVQWTQAVAQVEANRQPAASDLTTSDLTTSDLTTSDLTTSDLTTAAAGRKNDGRWVPAAWLTVAALACVAAMLLWNQGNPLPNPGRSEGNSIAANDTSALESGELAARWLDSRQVLVTSDLIGLGDPLDELVDEELFNISGPSMPEADVDHLQAPSWMTAALAASADTQVRE